MGKDIEGSHVRADKKSNTKAKDAASAESKTSKHMRVKRYVLAGAVVVSLYLFGVFFFNNHFYPQSTLFSHSVAFLNAHDTQEELNKAVNGYTLAVYNEHFEKQYSAADIGLTIKDDKLAQNLLRTQNAFLWPFEACFPHDLGSEILGLGHENSFEEKLKEDIDAYNENETPTKDATVEYKQDSDAFELASQVYGNQLDYDTVLAKVSKAIAQLNSKLKLGEEDKVQPKVTVDNTDLKDLCKRANEILTSEFKLNYKGSTIATLSKEDIVSALEFSHLELGLNEDWLTHYVDNLAGKLNSYGATRTIARPDGKTYQVKGGNYGWVLDKEALKSALKEALLSAKSQDIELVFSQTAGKLPDENMRDWGNRYIDVDLKEQMARFYGDDNSIIWEAPIVSGKPDGKHDTPMGIYVVNQKQSPSTLVGERDPRTNKPEYETKVSYWMPFVGNAVGFHDASWQSAFGGNRYATGYGSHGCINLAPNMAQSLYGLISQGDVVVVHG